MGSLRIARFLAVAAVVIGFMGCYEVSCGCPVDVRNNTPYYLHFLGQDESHLYVPPGGVRGMGFEYSDELRVLIAPGQTDSAEMKISISCSGCWNQIIDIQWDRSESEFLYERSGCATDASVDGGG
jgi:hypothetical protein